MNRNTSSRFLFFFFFSKFADPSKLGRSLLEGNKDHLLSHATSELLRQEHQVGSLNSCINELQQQAYAQRLELQDAHHGYIESRREQARLQENLSVKEKVPQDELTISQDENHLAQFSTICSGYAWARSKCVTSWCLQCTLQDWLRTNHTNFLNTDSLLFFFVHVRGYFQAIVPFGQSLIVTVFVVEFLCQAG